ncbi:MAG: two-component sensor histidine kinase [Acidimicrobiia bacterium]|nr:two-component sensor histidine kinase [Acidimicrobiia bacterium]
MTQVLLGFVVGALVAVVATTVLHRRRSVALTIRLAAATARRDEEANVRQQLAQALDAIPEGVAICDVDGRIVFHNATGSNYSEARHGDALVEAAIGELLGRALGGETYVETVELFGPPRRTLVITAVPLDPDTVGPGAVAVIDDVTEHRRLEAVRRDFVANISHELKTPVGALALLAETLIDEDDPAVTARLAGRMVTEAHRVGRTIGDLLELSSIEVEADKVIEVVPVRQILAGAVGRIRPAADQRGIRVELDEPDDALRVRGDRRQLVSALFNLLDNAVKYSEGGSVVHTRAVGRGDEVDIVVEDHGIGIPSRDLERVFERFYRVDQARSRQTGGTGLGLAIVRHVVNNHAGEVVVTSREGEGSTFTLRLPVGTAPDHPEGRNR